jgi:hypothetical protein
LIVVPASAARFPPRNREGQQVMQNPKAAFRPARTHQWTDERIAQLSKQDIKQLRDNASALGEEALVALCDGALARRPATAASRAGRPTPSRAGISTAPRTKGRRLLSRSKAFQARNAYPSDERTSWSAVRKEDGALVILLWAGAVVSSETGGCSYLLWAPNAADSRPWSDTAAGRERLEHCRLAMKGGAAEGLLVHGEALDSFLPEHKARSVHGVDPEIVLRLEIERRAEEYWAVWGRKAPK